MIKLTKNKAIYSNHYRPDSDLYVEKEVDKLFSHLDEVVELSDNFTLADLFFYIEREKDLFDVVFTSNLGHYPLQLFIDEIKKSLVEKDWVKNISYLELRRYGEYFEGDIEIAISFCGVNEETDDGYAIEFTPLNEIKHLPLKLNKTFRITKWRIFSKWVAYPLGWIRRILNIPLERWNPYERVYVSGTTYFTLYELISTVLSEISFCGSPEERDKKWNTIERDITEVLSNLQKAKDDENVEFGNSKKILEENKNEFVKKVL